MNLKLGLLTVLHPNLFTQEHCVFRGAATEHSAAKNMLEELALMEHMPFTSTGE